jgi:SAM-dependent methyltransferase
MTWNPSVDDAASENIIRLGKTCEIQSVLDAGCGSGRNLRPFNGTSAVVHGFDVDRTMVDLARTRLSSTSPGSDVRLWVDDIADSNHSGQYDLVVCHGVLHFLARAARLRAYENIKRWVRPGGLASVVLFNALTPIPPDLRDMIVDPPADSSELHSAFAGWYPIESRSYFYEDSHDHGRIRHTHSIDRLTCRLPD